MNEVKPVDDQKNLLANVFTKLTKWAQGRTTFFLIAHFTVALILVGLGKPLAGWIAFMSTHMPFVIGHSVKEDYFANKAGK